MAGNGLLIFTAIFLWFTAYVSPLRDNYSMWRWKCDATQETCTRHSSNSLKSNDTSYPSIEICRLVCGKYGALWPQPTISTTLSNTLFEFSLSSLKFNFPSDETKTFLQEAVKIFTTSVSQGDLDCSTSNTVTVTFTVSSEDSTLTWTTDESYILEVTTSGNQNSVKITAPTVFGARHALETLTQLIENDGHCYIILQEATIRDAPVYPHRGLLLDTARNFQTVTSIKTHIDAMGFSKLNVLHWHVTDSQSFPLELPSLPNMTKYGAYSDDKIYHPEDVADLLSYAKLRGVRVIIEIDAPSHAGNGWQWAPGTPAVCINQQPWRSYCIEPPCGQLNPVSSSLYTILKKLYSDVMKMLPAGEVFHMGGDEVFIPCWNSTPEIIAALGNKPRTTETFLDLWADYQDQARAVFDTVVGNSDTPIILWTSHLTDADIIQNYLSKDRYVIQTWVPAADTLPQDLLGLGYRIIVSTKDAWYLDHGFWGTTVYHGWKVVYNNHIPTNSKTLGGEVCMWGEFVDDSSAQSRVWPRASAAAERLWTDPKTNADSAAKRFYRHRERLVARGIHAEVLIPRWCYQNEGEC